MIFPLEKLLVWLIYTKNDARICNWVKTPKKELQLISGRYLLNNIKFEKSTQTKSLELL